LQQFMKQVRVDDATVPVIAVDRRERWVRRGHPVHQLRGEESNRLDRPDGRAAGDLGRFLAAAPLLR